MANTNRYPRRAGRADYRSPRPRPRPANTNRPPVRPPLPANDNYRPVPRPGRPPLVYPGGAARWGLLARLYNPARFIPILGLAWTAYELWQLWQLTQGGWSPPPSNYVKCRDRGPYSFWPNDVYKWLNKSGSCAEQLGAPGGDEWTASSPWFVWYQGRDTGAPLYSPRHQGVESVYYPEPPPFPPFYEPLVEVPYEPVMPDLPLPWLPYVEPIILPPLSPAPAPFPPPIYRPHPPALPEGSVRGPGPEVQPRDEPRVRPQRPPRRTRERKAIVRHQGLRRFLGSILSNYSELMDFMEAMHDALPEHLQATEDGQAAMLAALYANLNEVNMADAVMNYLENNQEDRISGRAWGRLTEAFEAYGIEVPTLRL